MFELLISVASLLCSFVVMIVVVVAIVFFISKVGAGGTGGGLGGGFSGGGSPQIDLYQKMFTDTLGYVSDVTPGDVQAQLRAGKAVKTHQVREVQGEKVHYHSSTRPTGTGMEVSLSWSLDLAGPVSHGIHIAEKSVASGLQRTVADLAMNRNRKFEPAFSQVVESGDAQLDKRFTFYADSLATAQRLVDIKSALLALPYVEVIAKDSQIVFNDPFQQALLATMGGPMGMASITTPQGIEKQVVLHNGVAELLILLKRQR